MDDGVDLVVDGTVFVSDDDERAFEEEADSPEVVVDGGDGSWSGNVQLQTMMCMVLVCTLLVEVLLIFLSWRKYGRLIMRSRAGGTPDSKKRS